MSISQRSMQKRHDQHPLAVGSQIPRRPAWIDIAERFTTERECLASYLALEAAEVIGGIKPANLINLVDRDQPCGRNMFRLWRRHGQRLLDQAGLAARELAQRGDGALLLIYHPVRMAAHLATPKVANFLRCAGYDRPECLEETLKELAERIAAEGFPHEIGAILGYPLKDVAGFMGWIHLPVTGRGPWKIYGDPRPSLEVVAACRSCREFMARRLHQGECPLHCLHEPIGNAFTSSCN